MANPPILDVARHYKSLTLSVLGCYDKKPVMGSWIAYKTNIASDEDLAIMFKERHATQVAIICGAVSQNLEVIDIDLKNDDSGSLFDDLWNAIVEYYKGQPPAFVLVATPSGGYHIYFRSEAPVPGNLKLATRDNENDPSKPLVMIETRGEGGYIIAPPSPNYKIMMGDIAAIPVISNDEVSDLHDICRTFNRWVSKYKDKPKSKILYSYKLTPWDQYNTSDEHPALAVMFKHGWEVHERSDRKGENMVYLRRPGARSNRWDAVYHLDAPFLLYVYSTSTIFEHERAYTPTAILAMLEHDGDFSAACATLRKQGFGTTFNETEKRAMDKAGLLHLDGYTFDEIFELLSCDYGEIKDSLPVAEKKAKIKKGIFWTRTKHGTLKIVKPLLADFLKLNGYALLGQSGADREKLLVHIDEKKHLIRETPIDQMKKGLQQWIFDTDFSEFGVHDAEVRECLFTISRSAWTDIFDWLDVMTIDACPILRDTKKDVFIPYRNCVVHITASGPRQISYDDLPKGTLVWDSQIIQRDVHLAPVVEDTDLNAYPTFLFIKRIAGVPPALDHLSFADLAAVYTKTWLQLQSFMTATGYLLTNYKDPENPAAIILAEDTPEEGKGGGTGKGLYMKFISHIRNVLTIFGREWKPDSEFTYQRVRPATDIIFMDDAPKNFNFQLLYNVLTEGIAINRKYKDEMMLPYSQSPKFAISTNYDVTADGDHGKRRQVKVYFQKYFTQKHKPATEFKKVFFSSEWNDNDWNGYDNSMFFLVQSYLVFGIVELDVTENMKIKQIRLNYREEFYDFMYNAIFEKQNLDYSVTSEFVKFETLYSDFLKASGLDSKEYSKRRFGYGMRYFAEQFHFKYEDHQIKSGADKGMKELKITLPDWLQRDLMQKAKEENDAQQLPF
jgi:hypothetical protein